MHKAPDRSVYTVGSLFVLHFVSRPIDGSASPGTVFNIIN